MADASAADPREPSGVPEPGALPAGHADWERVLSEMEAELAAVPTAASVDDIEAAAAWATPGRLGAVPEELRERAHRLLAAQRDVIGRLQRQQQETARQLAAVRSVPVVRDLRDSVYLDVTG